MNTNSDQHESRRKTKSEWKARILAEAVDILSQDRCHESGNERSGINGKVEDGEELFQLFVLLRTNELITAKSRNARLDPARPESDQEESHHRKFSIKQFKNYNFFMQINLYNKILTLEVCRLV